jgi:hypothetical protein
MIRLAFFIRATVPRVHDAPTREGAMSKLNIGIAAVVLVTVLSAAGYAVARGGGGHGGGGHGGGGHGGGGHGGGHFSGHAHFGGGGRHAGGRSVSFRSSAGFSRNRAFAVQNVRTNALNSRAFSRTMSNAGALRNPGIRAQIAAGAAIAGWHNGRSGSGWWRHSNGGYGWVGPLFWPFAYFDIYDYAIWGNGVGASFWGYGYDDIYAGMFAPYGYDDLAGYLPPRGSLAPGNPNAAPDRLAQMCGEASRDIAGLPIDLIQQAIEPTDTQRAALDDLANVSVTAAQNIKAACPTTISLTAPNRLASMQQRIEAMIAAVATVQPSLDKFYGLLNEEQKARFNALGENQRMRTTARRSTRPLVESCAAQSAAMQWPTAEIDARLRPTDTQRASLVALQDAGAKAADMLKTSCQADDAVTPPARLTAVGKRLDTMLQAIKVVRSALDDFYGTLSDEQKAQFEAIGPRRTALSDRPDTMRRHSRRYGF